MDNFYDKQDNLTQAKITLYKEYIEGYLIKLLMGFGECFIADLFCGPGKSGGKDGSPLTLVKRSKYILSIPQLKNKKPQIHILFSDKERSHIINLENELKEVEIDENVNILPIRNKSFNQILPEILKQSQYDNIPKFFFLDPFSYSDVKMDDLKKLMGLKNSEILLFLPVFHCYSFANFSEYKLDHKTRMFLEEFTIEGIHQYHDIDYFMKSIKIKLRKDLGLDFVRPILLDDGSRKNALFLLTKSQKAMLYMNRIALKASEDGRGITLKDANQKSLFGAKGTLRFKQFTEKLHVELKQRGEMSNKEIVKFTIIEEFLPKHAKDVLKILKEKKQIKVYDELQKDLTANSNKWNIAEEQTTTIIFKYTAR